MIAIDGIELRKVCIHGIDIPKPKTLVVQFYYDWRMDDMIDIRPLMKYDLKQVEKSGEDIGIMQITIEGEFDIDITT